MEGLPYQSFRLEVPSPSGSDDSGIGLSPNPPPGDLRACGTYASENPQESHFVSRSFYAGECAEGVAFNQWAYNQLGPDVNGSYLTDSTDNKKLPILNPNCNKDSYSQEIDIFLESISVQEKSTNKNSRKKANSQVPKCLINEDLNSKQILKLERCLQPKTGNGKPRQTSSKRKMNQTKKGDGRRPAIYPGVRPKTVREVLQHMRQSGQKGRAQPRQRQQRQIPFPSQNQPVMPHVPQPMANMAFSPRAPVSHEFMDQFRPTGSPPLHPNMGFPSPASNYSETPPPSYISEGSVMGDYDPSFDDMGVQPNISPFDQNQMCSANVFTCAEPNYIQSASPLTTVAASTPYQNPGACYPVPNFPAQQPSFAPADEYNDMHAFVTSQNFVTQENFPSYSCMSGAPTYAETSTTTMMSPYTPAIGVEGHEPVNIIHQLVVNGSVEELSGCLSQLAPNIFVNAKDDKGMTPLIYAVKMGNVEVVGELLKWGADPGILANDGQNLLHFAAELENPKMLDFLATTVPLFRKLVNGTATMKAGRTPLHIATEQKRQVNMVVLMQHGASLTAKEQHGGWSALHMAVKNADVKATQEILSFAAYGSSAGESGTPTKPRDLDALREVVCQRAYNENTAIHFAAELQVTSSALAEAQSLIINLLLDNEADPSIKNHQNQLPINLLSSSNSQLYERLRGGRRPTHSGRPANSAQCDMSMPPLRPVPGAQPTTTRFGGPSSGIPRSTFLE